MKTLILFCMLLTSCSYRTIAQYPIQTEECNSPFPSDYQQIIKSHLQEILIDPDSLRDLKISKPKEMWIAFPKYSQGICCYRCCVVFNSKNRMGGYTGKQGHIAIIQDGRLLFFDTMDSYYVKKMRPYPRECLDFWLKPMQ